MPNPNQDPYLYPGTQTLINTQEIRDPVKLEQYEADLFWLKSKESLPEGKLDYQHLKNIHSHFFGELYPWAGEERSIDIAKGVCYFGHKQYINKELTKLFTRLENENYLRGLEPTEFRTQLSYYFNEINAAHPFREGNGRTQRAFCELLATQAGYSLNWDQADRAQYIQASIDGFKGNYEPMAHIFNKIVMPLQQNLEQVLINENSLVPIQAYLKKQAELTHIIQQKHAQYSENLSKVHPLDEKLLNLSQEIKDLAKQIIADEPIAKLLASPQTVSLRTQGNFTQLNEKSQQGRLTQMDIIAIAKYAHNQVISTANTRTQSKSHSISR